MGKYQGYERYKDSGVDLLGKIPLNWIVLPIKFTLAMPITDGPHETPELQNEGVPFISAEAIKNDRIDFEKKRGFISIEEHRRFCKKYQPKYGDIYMVKSGATTGNVAKVETNEIFNIWSPLAVLRPNKHKIITEFLFYVIKSKTFFHTVELNWSFGTQQNIGMGVISNINIVIPPLEEQKQIAQFLDSKTAQIDALIAKKEALLEKLSEQRSAIITQAVTKGLDPTVPMKDSGIEWLGEIPKHWETCHLKRLAEISYGVGGEIDRTITEGINLLSLPNIKKDGEIFIDEVPKCVLDETEKKDLLLRKGDLLFNWRNGSSEHLGKTAYFDLDGEWTHVSFLLRLRFNLSIESRYFHYMLNGLRITGFFTSSKAGVNNTFNLNELRNLKIICPPKNEQELISSHIESKTIELDEMISRIKQAIALLKEYRTALITNAVTGKIDVRDIKLPESDQHQSTAINKNGTNR